MNFLTPVGRLVGGGPFNPQTKDNAGNLLVIKSGPDAGQPAKRWWMALAISKSDPGLQQLISTIRRVAAAAWPQLFDEQARCSRPDFAWKYVDGDSTIANKKGRKPCENEGYPGHWVFNFSGMFEPICFNTGGTEIITDPKRIKCGDFIRIYGSAAGNDSQQNPGIYLNYTAQTAVEWIAHGEEIKIGLDAKEVFGATPAAYMPPGASTTPPAPKTTIEQPQPNLPPPPPPANDFVSPTLYEIQGTKYTKQQLLDAGYTKAQIMTLADDVIPF